MKIRTKKRKQTNSDHQFEVATKLWDDYHQRTAAFAKRILEEVDNLGKCFNIEKETMEAAREESRKKMNETLGGIV